MSFFLHRELRGLRAFKWTSVPLLLCIALNSAWSRNYCEAQSSSTPLATCDAGNYVLEVWCVEDCKPNRSCHDIAHYMNLADNMNEPETFNETNAGGKSGGKVGGMSVSGGGGGGGGGSFRGPKKVFGIRVLDKKNRKSVKDAIFSAGYLVIEENGLKAESSLPESFRARYFWPPAPQESRGNIPIEELVPLPVFLNRPAATSLKSLRGVLIVPNEETARVTFTPVDIKNKARKSAGKYAVQIDSIQKANERIELNLLVTLPPQPAKQPGDFQSFMKQSQLAMSTRVHTRVEDSAGGLHFGAPQSRNSGGGSGGGSFTIKGSNQKTKRGSTQKNDEQPQKFPFHMSPTPEGTTTKELVCEVSQAKGAPQIIPFEFDTIQW